MVDFSNWLFVDIYISAATDSSFWYPDIRF